MFKSFTICAECIDFSIFFILIIWLLFAMQRKKNRDRKNKIQKFEVPAGILDPQLSHDI